VILGKFFEEFGECGGPSGGCVDDVEPFEFDVHVVVRYGIDAEWDDEISEVPGLCDTGADGEFVKTARGLVARGAEDVDVLGGACSECFFDVVPEVFAADELEEVAPDFVAMVSELEAEPGGELVVCGVRVADEDGVADWFEREHSLCRSVHGNRVRLERSAKGGSGWKFEPCSSSQSVLSPRCALPFLDLCF